MELENKQENATNIMHESFLKECVQLRKLRMYELISLGTKGCKLFKHEDLLNQEHFLVCIPC